jgi:hypothetical protein
MEATQMDWIDRFRSEQQSTEQRRSAALKEQQTRAREEATAFQMIAERLVPQVRQAIEKIEIQLRVFLRLEIGKDYLVIEQRDKTPGSGYFFVKIKQQGADSGLFIEATETGRWYAEGDGPREVLPALHLRTSLYELETRQLSSLLEWITGSIMGKRPQLPFQGESLAQQRREQKTLKTAANVGKKASRALILALISIPVCYLSPVALAVSLFTRWQLVKLGRRTGLAKVNWAIGISVVMVIYTVNFLLTISKLPLR